jgi:hypothetical protein
MTPAALHRQTDPLAATRRFIRSSTIPLLLSMFPLAVSICLEIYLIAHIITSTFLVGLSIRCRAFLVVLISADCPAPYREEEGLIQTVGRSYLTVIVFL